MTIEEAGFTAIEIKTILDAVTLSLQGVQDCLAEKNHTLADEGLNGVISILNHVKDKLEEIHG